jgi:hypothetical protein
MLNVVHRPFDISDQFHLSEDQLDRLRVIEDYDLWFVVERVRAKQVLSAQRVDEAVTEFRKYMALIALGHAELGMHSSDVDEIWHNFILFTREYAEFCQRICGHMIHHRPNTSRRPELPQASVSEFQTAYTTFFGPLAPIWRARKVLEAGDCDVAQDPPEVLHLQTDCDSANMGTECDSQGESTCQSDCGVTIDQPAQVSRLM